MKLSEANRPLRVFDKVMQGGLGAGNLGVIMSRHGIGKIGVLSCIAIDHALNGQNVLHVVLGKSVSDIRVFHDEVLHELMAQLDPEERMGLITQVERHKQIYSYGDGALTVDRLRDTVVMLRDHAHFEPALIDIQGWPDFENVDRETVEGLRNLAKDFNCEMWVTAHTHYEGDNDERGVPGYIRQFEEDLIDVLVALEPEANLVRIKFLKTHDQPPADGVHLEFDPKTQLIRWR